ncbi:hypothetical protein MKW94_002541 [Papaver nudicaule]|uniref:Splicing factor YJU2 n=1 Tax=Papaver nudicaule TaxID=74823 RepID=A0AA41SBL0_PAPNU|nr:hypothetical protein [Papaver nudicaule]
MGERKVQNHYIPPDFDPVKIPRAQHNNQTRSRTMLSMSIRCNTCGNYIGAGTKLNSRKEFAGEDYLGIKIYRLYSKCTTCSAEFTVKTDPRNSDYTVEFGATRNFEPWRVEEDKLKDAEEIGDPLKSLENRARVSKREMDIDADIDQVKSIKARHSKVSVDAILETVQRNAKGKEDKLDERDEALIKSIFGPKEVVSRIPDKEDQPSVCAAKRKIVLDTGSRTKQRFRKPSVGEELNLSKLISKSSRVKVSVIKKPRK